MSDPSKSTRIPTLGVNAYLRPSSTTNDSFELVLDDTVLDDTGENPVWEQRGLFTNRQIQRNKINDFVFTDEELMGIGRTLMARLHAFQKTSDR